MKTIFKAVALCAALGFVSASGTAMAADADAYPSKPIRLIVPYPAGGGTDTVARALSAKLQASMRQPVIVENRPGAGTMIGTDVVAKAKPDGYTIGLITDSHAINPSFSRKIPYDSQNDFTTVTQLLSVPFMLLAHPSVPANNMTELIAYAKANPGKLTFASLGPGSPHELAMEWLKKLAGIDVLIVPYKGVAPATVATLGGQTNLTFAGSSTGVAYIQSGKLKLLGVSTPKRLPDYPQVQAIDEVVPNFVVETWYGIAAPANLPPAIAGKLNQEIFAALASPEMKDLSKQLGFDIVGNTPAQMSQMIKAETQKWKTIIETTGAKVE
ncbi:MAG: tripartite tricarboxylate transporter substrate binding protein [Variovorax sp.]